MSSSAAESEKALTKTLTSVGESLVDTESDLTIPIPSNDESVTVGVSVRALEKLYTLLSKIEAESETALPTAKL